MGASLFGSDPHDPALAIADVLEQINANAAKHITNILMMPPFLYGL